jgi:hypothetical protein
MISKPVRFTKFTPNVIPACFKSGDAWEAWREAARRKPPIGNNWVCGDCTTSYQAGMITAGRCAYPEKDLTQMEVEDEAA